MRENPCTRVERESEKGRAREIYLSPGESRALLSKASPTFRPMLLTALSTGMRFGELEALEWRDVDLSRKEIRVRAEVAKGGRGRTIPMTVDLALALASLRVARPRPSLAETDRVLCLSDGSAVTYGVVRGLWATTRRSCREVIAEAKRAGLRFHDLRHTAASLMVASGVSIFDVSKILGHATLSQTLRYAHFAPDNARASVERFGLAAAFAAAPQESAQVG